MALRPIENALLPPTPDRSRPKKIPKIPSATVTDENREGPQCQSTTVDPVATIDYVSSTDLKPFTDPDAKIQALEEGLESKDWVRVCQSLNDVRVLAIYHSDLQTPSLEKVISVLVKAMKNPRSALCKTSIMASSDVFSAYGDKLLQLDGESDGFDQLVFQLLLKSSQDKRFVCEEADKALKSMVHAVSPPLLLKKLKTYIGHSNLRVRAKAAVCISRCVSKMTLEELKDYGSASLLQMAAELLNDRLPEAREAARSIVTTLYESFAKEHDKGEIQESWRSYCEANLPALHAQSIVKVTVAQ
ncbi:hypothetical protein Droror1_Dr00000932 [Drosera rotundifolia]